MFFLLQLPAIQASAETHKFAIIFGNNRGHDPAETLRYAESDAEKVYRVLTELGGFRKADTQLILNAEAKHIEKAIAEAETRIARRRRKTGEKTLFLLFYSGHAEGDVLELGNSSLKFQRLLSFLQFSSAEVRLAFIDSCQSGRLIATKGGRRGPSFDIRVTDEITSKGYAVITSSAHNELSQESAEIRGAFFTHFLVSALRGAADSSGDGKVTLNEAYNYAYTHTLARTSATIGGSQHPMYEFELQGRGEIVLTRTDKLGSYISVQHSKPGRLLILDLSGDAVIAETQLSSHKAALISVTHGEYAAYLLTPEERVWVAHAKVEQGQILKLDNSDFQPIRLKASVSKGGLFPSPEEGWKHSLKIAGMWRLWPLQGADSSYGASIIYRLMSPSGMQPIARLSWSTRDDVGVSTDYNDLGLLIGVGYAIPFSWIVTRVELLAGYEHLFQSKWNNQNRHTSGFDYLGMLGIDLLLDGFLLGLDLGAGGRAFQVIDKGWVHRFDAQVLVGVGFTWSAGE